MSKLLTISGIAGISDNVLGIIVDYTVIWFYQRIVDHFFVDIDHSHTRQLQSNCCITHLAIQRVNVFTTRYIVLRACNRLDEASQIAVVEVVGDVIVAVHTAR